MTSRRGFAISNAAIPTPTSEIRSPPRRPDACVQRDDDRRKASPLDHYLQMKFGPNLDCGSTRALIVSGLWLRAFFGPDTA